VAIEYLIRHPQPNAPQELTSMGLNLSNMTDGLRKRYNIKDGVKGLIITGVDAKSAAAKKKQLIPGNVILEVQQRVVHDPSDFKYLIEMLKQEGKDTALLFLESPDGMTVFETLRIK
jgi:serine protease Do